MEKRYTDREVSLILRRALESEADVVDASSPEAGLSLEEIREVAVEVGIDPERIDLAAAGLANPHRTPANPLVGIPTTVQFETTVAELDPCLLSRHEVLDTIRRTLGRQGIAGEAADSITWQARDVSGGRYVTMSPTGDGVRLRILGNYRDALLGVFAAAGTAVFGLASVVLEGLPLGTSASLAIAAVTGLATWRLSYRWWRMGEDRRMAALHGRLLAILRASGANGGTASSMAEMRLVDSAVTRGADRASAGTLESPTE